MYFSNSLAKKAPFLHSVAFGGLFWVGFSDPFDPNDEKKIQWNTVICKSYYEIANVDQDFKLKRKNFLYAFWMFSRIALFIDAVTGFAVTSVGAAGTEFVLPVSDFCDAAEAEDVAITCGIVARRISGVLSAKVEASLTSGRIIVGTSSPRDGTSSVGSIVGAVAPPDPPSLATSVGVGGSVASSLQAGGSIVGAVAPPDPPKIDCDFVGVLRCETLAHCKSKSCQIYHHLGSSDHLMALVSIHWTSMHDGKNFIV